MKSVLQSFSPAVGAMAALLLLAILQLAVHGQAKAPPAGTVKIMDFAYNGNGCPAGSLEGAISADGQALTLMFSQYTATTDGSVMDRRSSCTVTIKLQYPSGFVFTLGTVTMRGYANLEAGVKGTIRTSYHLSGMPGTGHVTHHFNGPFDENYEVSDKFVSAVASVCNVVRDLQLKSEVRVIPKKANANGYLTMDSKDLKLTQMFHFHWNTC